jgi:hypothetical protein
VIPAERTEIDREAGIQHRDVTLELSSHYTLR